MRPCPSVDRFASREVGRGSEDYTVDRLRPRLSTAWNPAWMMCGGGVRKQENQKHVLFRLAAKTRSDAGDAVAGPNPSPPLAGAGAPRQFGFASVRLPIRPVRWWL